jgi:hypothetical protein
LEAQASNKSLLDFCAAGIKHALFQKRLTITRIHRMFAVSISTLLSRADVTLAPNEQTGENQDDDAGAKSELVGTALAVPSSLLE